MPNRGELGHLIKTKAQTSSKNLQVLSICLLGFFVSIAISSVRVLHPTCTPLPHLKLRLCGKVHNIKNNLYKGEITSSRKGSKFMYALYCYLIYLTSV
jgi:hypothetical protein